MYYYYYVYVCIGYVCTCSRACATMCMWRAEDNFVELNLSLLSVYGFQESGASELCGRHFAPVPHLIDSSTPLLPWSRHVALAVLELYVNQSGLRLTEIPWSLPPESWVY